MCVSWYMHVCVNDFGCVCLCICECVCAYESLCLCHLLHEFVFEHVCFCVDIWMYVDVCLLVYFYVVVSWGESSCVSFLVCMSLYVFACVWLCVFGSVCTWYVLACVPVCLVMYMNANVCVDVCTYHPYVYVWIGVCGAYGCPCGYVCDPVCDLCMCEINMWVVSVYVCVYVWVSCVFMPISMVL